MPPFTPNKGLSIRVFDRLARNAISDVPIDMRCWNALNLHIYVNGTAPYAKIYVEGSDAGGGIYLPIPDALGKGVQLYGNVNIDSQIGSSFARVRLAEMTGTYAKGQGWTVVATPFVSGGQNRAVVKRVVAANDTSVTDGETVDLWTPSTGYRFALMGGVFKGSITGVYTLVDGEAGDFLLPLLANTPFPLHIGADGWVSFLTDNVLKIQNTTGSTAAITATVWGTEVL